MAGLKFQSKLLSGSSFAEVGVLDEAFDAALAAQAGLVGEQAMQELQVRPAGVLGSLKAASSWSAVTGIRKVAKSARIWSRRLAVAVGSSGSSSGFSSDGVSSAGSSGKSKC